jgi:hypothetical protein
MRASEFLDEYNTGSSVHIDAVLKLGDEYNSRRYLKPVNVPLQGVTVKYRQRDNGRHSYFMFNDADRCIGVFSLDEIENPVLSKILAPGVRLVTPHMTLSPQLQRTGIATKCYTTFLDGGPWVFVTKSHSEGAKSLWDKLSMGNYVSMYYYEDLDFHGRLVKDPSQIEPQAIANRAMRVMGPRDRFKN